MIVFNYIEEFEGIIGAVLGSISTLIVTDFLKRRGKLHKYIINKHYGFWTQGSYGEVVYVEDIESVQGLSLRYKLQIYNSYDMPKILRNFKVGFYKNKKLLYECIPLDEGTTRVSVGGSVSEEASIININSKQIIELQHMVSVFNEDISMKQLTEIDCVELSFFNDKNKIESINILKEIQLL